MADTHFKQEFAGIILSRSQKCISRPLAMGCGVVHSYHGQNLSIADSSVSLRKRLMSHTAGFSKRFSIKAGGEFRGFDDLPYENEYILDSNLVISYQKNGLPGWNSFVDSHLKLGKKFYLLPPGVHELRAGIGIPKGFELLDIEDPKGDY